MRNLSTRCNNVLGQTWTKQCQGRYSYDIKVKYGNRLVDPGDPYVIHYMPPHKYLITMGKSQLDKAETVVLSPKGFLDENNKTIEKLKYLGCVPYRLRFTEDLVAHCKGPGFRGYAHFSVLNYAVYDFNRKQAWESSTSFDDFENATYFSNSSANSLGGLQWWPLLLMGCMLLVKIYRSLNK